MEKKVYDCYICKEPKSPLFIFSCSHKLCAQCLIRRIFIHFIQQFEDPGPKVIPCLCREGTLSLEMDNILGLFKTKTVDETQKQKQPICKLHENKPKEHYCKDCHVIVCKECSLNKENEHYEHDIENNNDYAKKLKYYLNKIQMKYKTYNDFSENLEKIGKKFKEIIEGTYNSTLQNIDTAIKELNLFRSEYVANYQKKLEIGVFTLKLLKLFYLTYYYDSEKAQKSNDVDLIKYINDINYELDDVQIVHNLGINQNINDINKLVENLKKTTEDALKLNFSFTKVPRNYINLQTIEKAHQKLVTAIAPINNSKFVSGSKDYSISIWEEADNVFTNTYTKSEFTGQIVSIIKLKDNRIVTSSARDNTIKVWKDEEDIKSFSCEQTLNGHTQPVVVLVELFDLRLVSGSLDSTIIVWEEEDNAFQIKQILKKHTSGIYGLICLFDSRIVSSSADTSIIIWKETAGTFYPTETLTRHTDRIRTLCQLKDNRIASGGDENIIFIWKQNSDELYQLERRLRGHEGAINVLIRLKDGRFASASKDRTVIIWEIDSEGKIDKSEILVGHDDGVYALAQLEDGRICTGGNDCKIIVWGNRSKLL